jgi:hypothetical protein
MRTRGSPLEVFTFMIEYVGDIYITTFTLGYHTRICLFFTCPPVEWRYFLVWTCILRRLGQRLFQHNDSPAFVRAVIVCVSASVARRRRRQLVLWYRKIKQVGYGSHGSCDTNSGAGVFV